jgi:hypothetical protein
MNLKRLESYLRVNLLGPGPRLKKKNLPGRGLTKVEKHCCRIVMMATDWSKQAFFLWRCDPTQVMASSFLMFLDHTKRRTKVGRTPLDE